MKWHVLNQVSYCIADIEIFDRNTFKAALKQKLGRLFIKNQSFLNHFFIVAIVALSIFLVNKCSSATPRGIPWV